MVTDSI